MRRGRHVGDDATARAVAYLADLHDIRVGDLGTRWAGDVEDTIRRAERNDSPDAMIRSVRYRLHGAGLSDTQVDYWLDAPDARMAGQGTDYGQPPTPRQALEDGNRRLVDRAVSHVVDFVAPVVGGSRGRLSPRAASEPGARFSGSSNETRRPP